MNEKAVLVVDDEKNIRLTLTRALETMELTVETAVNGEEAVEKLVERSYPLVLLDLRLPGMDGLEVLRKLRALQPETKVIIITAHGTVENAVEAMKLGAVEFLQKPFTSDEIRSVVKAALARRGGFFRSLQDRKNRDTAGTEGLTKKPGAADTKREIDRAKEGEPSVKPEKESYEFCIQQVKAAMELQRFDDAAAWAEQAVASDSSRPEVFNLLGILCEIRRDVIQAQKYYRAALSLDPTYEPSQRNLSRTVGLGKDTAMDAGGSLKSGEKQKGSFLGSLFGPRKSPGGNGGKSGKAGDGRK